MKIEAIPSTNRGDDRSISIPWLILHCIGFGSCWAWVHIGFFSSVLLPQTAAVGLNAWIYNIAANGLAMVCIGLFARRRDLLNRNPRFIAAVVLAVTIGTFIIAFAWPVLPDALWYLLGPILTGAGTAGLLLLWAEAYMAISTFSARKYTLPGAMTTGVLIYLLAVSLPRTLAIFMTALLPVLSILCLRSTYSTERPAEQIVGTDEGPKKTTQRNVLIKFLFAISVYCIASGFMSGQSTYFTDSNTSVVGTMMFSGIAILLIGVTVLSIVFVERDQEDFAYRMIVPLMAAGLLLMPFLADTASNFAADIAIMGGYIILEMFVWSSLQDIAHNATEHPAMVFGIGKSGMNLGLLVGCLLGMYAASLSTMIMLGVSVLIVYLFILFGALAPNGRQSGFLPVFYKTKSAAQGGEPGGSTTETLDSMRRVKCRAIAEEYGLSAREEEVLFLISYGRSINLAAESLGIAPSTVKSHKDHIYQKLDIHNRQELLDLMEG